MFRPFKKLSWFIKMNRKNYIISMSLLILSYVVIIIPPKILGDIADTLNTGTITREELMTKLTIFAIVVIINYLNNYGWSFFLYRSSDSLSFETRSRLMNKFLKQSPIFYEKNSTGSLMGKSTNDVNALSEFAGFGFMSLTDATLYPLSLIIVMATTVSYKLTFFSILPLPLIMVATRLLDKEFNKTFTAVQEAFDEMNDKVLENVSGVRVVRSYVREEHEIEVFKKLAKKNYDVNFRLQKLISLWGPLDRIIPAVSTVIALVVGARYIALGTLSIGKLISFTIYLGMLIWPMMSFAEYYTAAKEADTAMDRIQELWDYKEEVVDKENALTLEGFDTIELKGLNFRYPSAEEDTLKDITFTLKRGETLGIVGKIGSGKTTLIKQLLHLYPIKEMLYINGSPIEDYSQHSLRSHIGYTPQAHVLFSKTIRENIELGLRGTGDIQSAIDASDFTKDLAQLPSGLETLTGEKGISLSGGQKQRISIARAIISNPDLLILDDSLSAVDATTEANILGNIKSLRSGKTNIISAHRLSAVSHADLILVLDEGRIIERGTHEELIALGGWYKEQYIHQQMEVTHENR
ncbi:ABC transporter ATP-binding protein [Guggenheimella bovis]